MRLPYILATFRWSSNLNAAHSAFEEAFVQPPNLNCLRQSPMRILRKCLLFLGGRGNQGILLMMATHRTPRLGERARQGPSPGFVLFLGVPGGKLLLQLLPRAFIHLLKLIQSICGQDLCTPPGTGR